MKAHALVTAFLIILLAGCSLRGGPAKSAVPPAAPKPAANSAPAPPPLPPAPLSIPQTRVELPKPQPLDPAALETTTETETTPPEQPPAVPARSRRAGPAASQPATAPPVAATPPPEPRETVQEIVSAAELKRLQDRAQGRRREVNRILDQLGRRRVTGNQPDVAATIRSFLALSEEAEKHNDMRQADALAERAQILAQELQSGK